MEINNPKTAGQKRRVTVKLTHPNPLFEKWLTEWKIEAETKDSKLKYSFQHALKSLQKYPIPLESGKECAILKGFGTRICQMLDQRLREYRANRENKNDDNQIIENEAVSKPKRSRKSKGSPVKVSKQKSSTSSTNYIPRPGSGGYAILLALLTKEQEATYPGFVLKSDLITSAQHYCDKSMTVAEPGTRYTAWSSMKTLLEKDLVRKRGNPAKFSLTDDGRNIAINLHADITNEDDEIVSNPLENQFLNSSRSSEKSKNSSKSSPEESFKKPFETKTYNSKKTVLNSEKKCETITKPLNDENEYPNIDSYKFNTVFPSSQQSSPVILPDPVDPCEIICLDDDDSNSPNSSEHKFEFNLSGDKKSLEDGKRVSSEYIPDSGSNEFILLRKIFLQSQEFNYSGFLLKSDLSPENISSMEILLKNGLIEDDFNKISITDKGLNVAIDLLTTTDIFNRPTTPKVETNEEIIEGILNSPLFKNKFRISNFNFDDDCNNFNEDHDLPINSPPKSPFNWKSKSPEVSDKMETIDLDHDRIGDDHNFNEDYDLTINSPPKSPFNWKSKSPEVSDKMETIDLDHDRIGDDHNFNEDYDLPINSSPKSPLNWKSKSPEVSDKMETILLDCDGIDNGDNFNEDHDLPINIPPKSPLNWKSKSPESSDKIKNKFSDIEISPPKSSLNWKQKYSESSETIDLDDDIIISENPIFSKIKNKLSDIETKINNAEKKLENKETKKDENVISNKFTDNSNKNTILSDNFKSKEKKGNKKLNKDILVEKDSPKEDTRSNFDDIIFQPSRFEIILLVDTQETAGPKKSNLNDVTQHELTRHGIKFEIRRLSVGDFAWIARNNLNQELILPYILERKRMDDLSSSIKDGRFHEQKFRLKHCGIQNLMYLVESYGSKDHLGLPFNTLLQAATNTQVQENFIVKFTECHKHSMAYISTFTKQLIQIFKDKTLTGCSKESLIDSDITDRIIPLMIFSEFNKASTKNKNVKVRELFIRQLLQIKGVSFEKAMAITEKYPTPLRLRIAYMKNPDYVGEKLLSSIQYSKMNRFIGPAISKSIYQLYTKKLL